MKSAGIDEVLVMCVNDAAVMGAWAKDQKIEGSNISFIADPNSLVTEALGMELTAPGPCAKLGPKRCKRFAMYVDDGVVKVINVSEAPDANPRTKRERNNYKTNARALDFVGLKTLTTYLHHTRRQSVASIHSLSALDSFVPEDAAGLD